MASQDITRLSLTTPNNAEKEEPENYHNANGALVGSSSIQYRVISHNNIMQEII